MVASTQRQYICTPTAHGSITIQMFQDQNSCDSLILKNPSQSMVPYHNSNVATPITVNGTSAACLQIGQQS